MVKWSRYRPGVAQRVSRRIPLLFHDRDTRKLYQDFAAQIITSTSTFQSWDQAFRIIGFLGCSPNINLVWCWLQGEGWLIWTYYVFSVIRCLGIIIITPSFRPFSIVFSNQRFGNCSSAVDIGLVKLLSNCFCGNRVFKMNTEFCCYLCYIISLIFRHNPLHLVWFSVTVPLSCLPIICVCLNKLGNCCSGYT